VCGEGSIRVRISRAVFCKKDVISEFVQWLCHLPELHVFGGIQYSFLLQEALNFSNII